MDESIGRVEQSFIRKEIPPFRAGDTVRVEVKVTEGDKQRLQAFEGTVLQRKGSGVRETFTVRRISGGVGVERIFPLHSPCIERISVLRHGKVRRRRIFYLRKRTGKSAKVREERITSRGGSESSAKE
jgi:large subunit ribosomal protein L19